jgi:hypothetical protein
LRQSLDVTHGIAHALNVPNASRPTRKNFKTWSADELAHRIAMEALRVVEPMTARDAMILHNSEPFSMWAELEARKGKATAARMIEWHRADYIAAA